MCSVNNLILLHTTFACAFKPDCLIISCGSAPKITNVLSGGGKVAGKADETSEMEQDSDTEVDALGSLLQAAR